MVETRVYQISLTPKPLSVTLREFNSERRFQRLWWRGRGRALLVQGDLEEEKCWRRREGWGIGEQQDHRDERLDARTVLLCLDWAWAVMELMKSPGYTDPVSEAGWRFQRSIRPSVGGGVCCLQTVLVVEESSQIGRKWEKELEARTVQRWGSACTPFVIFLLNFLPFYCPLSLKSAIWYWLWVNEYRGGSSGSAEEEWLFF